MDWTHDHIIPLHMRTLKDTFYSILEVGRFENELLNSSHLYNVFVSLSGLWLSAIVNTDGVID